MRRGTSRSIRALSKIIKERIAVLAEILGCSGMKQRIGKIFWVRIVSTPAIVKNLTVNTLMQQIVEFIWLQVFNLNRNTKHCLPHTHQSGDLTPVEWTQG